MHNFKMIIYTMKIPRFYIVLIGILLIMIYIELRNVLYCNRRYIYNTKENNVSYEFKEVTDQFATIFIIETTGRDNFNLFTVFSLTDDIYKLDYGISNILNNPNGIDSTFYQSMSMIYKKKMIADCIIISNDKHGNKTLAQISEITAAKVEKASTKHSKVLFILQDPLNRALSHWLLSCYDFSTKQCNSVSRLRQGEMFTNEVTIKDTESDEIIINKTHPVIVMSKYDDLIKPWMSRFNHERMMIVNGDNLYDRNTDDEIDRVERFIGIKPVIFQGQIYYNQQKKTQCLRRGYCFKQRLFPLLEGKVHRAFRSYYTESNNYIYKTANRNFAWS